MRVFSHLHIEQDCAIELVSQYDEALGPDARAGLGLDLCRIAGNIAQVRDEIVVPSLALTVLDRRLLDDAIIDMDLVSLVVNELYATRTTEFLYDGLVRSLGSLLERRFALDEAPEGLWTAASRTGADLLEIDLRIGRRLRELDRFSRTADWRPAPPAGFETCRASVPPGAAPRNAD
ncbi:hypothetical protein BH10PSE1_BH10PSE1_13620 [soil metagenome]